ncbi:MAG: CRISPR-associated endonuclease Cas2 [Andreesenia angusta]|nr:CRISPR-associated endonuclease Cas2 [Andreesenia angusta]
MSYRFMRVIVLFDLPTYTSEDMRDYRRFRKYLLKSGFFMLQESVYCKLALNHSIVKTIELSLKKNKPKSGLVQVLVITEKQYSKMIYLVGERKNDKLDDDDRTVII